MEYIIEIENSDGSISVLNIFGSDVEQITTYSVDVDGVEITFKDKVIGIWVNEEQ
jgi:hypothetical protein